MKKTQKKLGNKGFSLVELIVVIAIMAVLVGVLAPTQTKLTSKKYSGVSGGITVKVNTNGQVSINGVPES